MCENICIGIEGEGAKTEELKGRKLRMREREKKKRRKRMYGQTKPEDLRELK